jgi:hypothetical protein
MNRSEFQIADTLKPKNSNPSRRRPSPLAPVIAHGFGTMSLDNQVRFGDGGTKQNPALLLVIRKVTLGPRIVPFPRSNPASTNNIPALPAAVGQLNAGIQGSAQDIFLFAYLDS